MKIFLSWSKIRSGKLAEIFSDWLPNVLQYVDIYLSSDPESLGMGERSFSNIQQNLEESSFGLIFVTPENIDSPWINFEAGALSKKMDAKVVPILYESNLLMLDKGPLKQFQSAKDLSKKNIYDLIKSINNSKESHKIKEDRLETIFEKWWPDLEQKVNNIPDVSKDKSSKKEPSSDELIKEIYNKVSKQDEFIKRQSNFNKQRPSINPIAMKDLKKSYILLQEYIDEDDSFIDNDDLFNRYETVRKLKRAITHIEKKMSKESSEIRLKKIDDTDSIDE